MIKLKRRIGSAFLACMMLLSLLPVTAMAAEDSEVSTIAIGATMNGCIAVDSNHTVYIWGNNYSGELGLEWVPTGVPNGASMLATPSVQEDATKIGNIVNVVGGDRTTLALTEDGSVYGWGRNNYGQTGNQTQNDSAVAEVQGLPAGDPVVEIYAGSEHSMALTESGKLYSWGLNDRWQLGRENTGDTGHGYIFEPTAGQVNIPAGETIISASSAGGHMNYAVAESGKIYSWGEGDFGVLGDNVYNSHTINTPTDMSDVFNSILQNDEKVISVETGKYSVYFVTDLGNVYTLGLNYSGELGVGDNSVPTVSGNKVSQENCALTPEKMMLPEGEKAISVVPVATYGGFTLIQTESGKLYGTGSNSYQVLAESLESGANYTNVPVEIDLSAIDGGIKDIVATSSSVLLLTTKGTVYSWGGSQTGATLGRYFDGFTGLLNANERAIGENSTNEKGIVSIPTDNVLTYQIYYEATGKYASGANKCYNIYVNATSPEEIAEILTALKTIGGENGVVYDNLAGDNGRFRRKITIQYETTRFNGNPVDGDSLRDAIEKANDGDVITLTPGTYDGDFVIDGKSITILGANAGVSGTSDNRGAESVITGQVLVNGKTTDTPATAVTFDGLKFTGDGSISTRMGANYYGVNLTVQNCVAENLNNTFVYTRGVTGNGQDRLHGTITIKDNLVSNITGENNSAFNLWYASEHVITGNYVEGIPYNAFNLNATSGPVVFTNNTIKDIGQSGFQIANSAADDVNVEIKDNSFEEIGNSAIRLYGDIASDLEITGNTVEGDCIAINLADAENVTDAIISGNTQNGNPVGVTGSVDGLFLVTVIDRDNIIDTANITKNTGYELPAAPSRAGYSFRGWYGNGHLYADGDVVTITEDTTFVAQWSDNTPYYTITVKDADNGTVTCYAKSAAKGADVTLNVKADVGYQLDKLTVTDASGNVIDVEKVNNTTYTFVMPGSKVTVEAVFAPTTVEPSGLPFTDVSTSDWFYSAVKFVYENGLMDGVGNNLFAPNATLNRAMAVTILYRLEGAPAVTTDAGFNDVAAGTWYTDAVNWAAANNIVNGVEGNNFDPTGSLTREQMATILYRYAQYKGADVSAAGDISGFADSANVSSWAADAVKWAVGTGLVNGVEGNALAPQGTSTRAQAATVLMRFVG